MQHPKTLTRSLLTTLLVLGCLTSCSRPSPELRQFASSLRTFDKYVAELVTYHEAEAEKLALAVGFQRGSKAVMDMKPDDFIKKVEHLTSKAAGLPAAKERAQGALLSLMAKSKKLSEGKGTVPPEVQQYVSQLSSLDPKWVDSPSQVERVSSASKALVQQLAGI